MKEIDYSKVNNISLKTTGLLSNYSDGLMQFLYHNEIKTVGKFLELVDSNYYEPSKYMDVMLEVNGLADLLKYKYFNVPISTDIYLKNPITYSVFNIYESDFTMLGIMGTNNKKINIYSVITRLGFNDKERTIILDREQDYLVGKNLIQILLDVYNDIKNGAGFNIDNQVFYNKILLYITYFNEMEKRVKEEQGEKTLVTREEQVYINTLLEELEKLRTTRDELNSAINTIEDILRELGVELKGGRK